MSSMTPCGKARTQSAISLSESLNDAGDHLSNLSEYSRTAASPRAAIADRMASTVLRTCALFSALLSADWPDLRWRIMAWLLRSVRNVPPRAVRRKNGAAVSAIPGIAATREILLCDSLSSASVPAEHTGSRYRPSAATRGKCNPRPRKASGPPREMPIQRPLAPRDAPARWRFQESSKDFTHGRGRRQERRNGYSDEGTGGEPEKGGGARESYSLFVRFSVY